MPNKQKKKVYRCNALSDEGRICGKPASTRISYHGDKEIYPYKVCWVRVWLCEKHKEVIKEQNL